MRTPNLSLAALALAVVPLIAACSSGTSATYPPSQAEPPAHHYPTPEPYPPYQPEPTQAASTPYDGVTYEDPGVNPFVPTERDRESTFGLDVDTASYAIARRYVDDGNLPDPSSVRVEEFVNAFPHDYPAPRDGTFALYADGGPSPFLARDEVLLRLGVKAREVSDAARPAASLTFVIDTSGSMEREDRLELVKRSLALLVDRLGRDDTVAIVTYGSEARVVLDATSVRDATRIVDAIDGLRTDGSTNAEAGLTLGFELAAHAFREDGINRLILASDGVANSGETDPEALLRRVHWDQSLGIQLVTVGFGMGNYNDALMEQLADKGDGFYAYVNTLDDARTLFGEQLTSTLQTVALDARAQVELDPALVESYRLIGYENRDLPDEAFRDDRVDAGAIGAGHSVTALYALRLAGERQPFNDTLGTLRLRWTEPGDRDPDEISLEIRTGDLATDFDRTAPSFRLDALVAAAAEVFRGSRWADEYRIRDVAEVAYEESRDLPRTAETDDFLRLLDRAASLER